MDQPASHQDEAVEVQAVAVLLPPLVMKDGDQLTGFGIDLWREVTARLKVKTSYQLVDDVNAYRVALRSKRARVGVTPIYYTTELDREFDFSYPILAAGLQVMVRDEGSHLAPAPLRDLLSLLLSRSAAMWLGIAVVMILVPAHVIWLLERGAGSRVIPSRDYVPGIFEATPPRYFASHQGRGRVKVVGPEVRVNEVGFLFQLNDPLHRKVNSTLLALKEDGTYDRLCRKWLGDA